MKDLDPYVPCPCGSGKKYKFCCRGKSKRSLHDPVSIISARSGVPDVSCERGLLAGPAWFEGSYHGSFLNRDWRRSGLAVLLTLRRAEALLYGHAYLIDVFGLGLKDCYPLLPLSEAELHANLLPNYATSSKLEPCPEDTARKLAWGGLHWGRQNGFRPPKCWERCLAALGEEPDGPRVDVSLFGFDHGVHIMGEWEDIRKRMVQPMGPEEAMEEWSSRGFHFTIGGPAE
ncbi:MAG: SEC-C domain-containing protein [Planctomycetes bacterium]|nr:SEC-C domain-containing protein [Planctomycetota bacterium]